MAPSLFGAAFKSPRLGRTRSTSSDGSNIHHTGSGVLDIPMEQQLAMAGKSGGGLPPLGSLLLLPQAPHAAEDLPNPASAVAPHGAAPGPVSARGLIMDEVGTGHPPSKPRLLPSACLLQEVGACTAPHAAAEVGGS